MQITDITDDEVKQSIVRLWQQEIDELHTLRVSIARLAQAMNLGHEIPKPRSIATGDEMQFNMQEAPYEVLRMAAITERGWNRLVGIMVEAVVK